MRIEYAKKHIIEAIPEEVTDKNLGGFSRVPSILFDRGIYPKSLGLSDDAYRLYLFECASINKISSLHYCKGRAAYNHLGMQQVNYESAKRELVKSGLVFQHRPPNPKSSRKYWAVSIPPIIRWDSDKSQYIFTRPEAGLKGGRSPNFHRGKTPFSFIRVPKQFGYSFLRSLPSDEIDCYLNLLWQNREPWFGVNPNFIRYGLNTARFRSYAVSNLHDLLQPSEEHGDKIILDQIFEKRMRRPEAEICQLINSLVKRQLFTWVFWLAQSVTYHEQRRGIEPDRVRLYAFLDCRNSHRSMDEDISLILEKLQSPSVFLIAQLRSVLKLDSNFEKIVDLNCSYRNLLK